MTVEIKYKGGNSFTLQKVNKITLKEDETLELIHHCSSSSYVTGITTHLLMDTVESLIIKGE